jgi:hypothetical protein
MLYQDTNSSHQTGWVNFCSKFKYLKNVLARFEVSCVKNVPSALSDHQLVMTTDTFNDKTVDLHDFFSINRSGQILTKTQIESIHFALKELAKQIPEDTKKPTLNDLEYF